MSRLWFNLNTFYRSSGQITQDSYSENIIYFPSLNDRFQLILLEETDSTNRVATEQLSQHQPDDPYPIVIAKTQTAGRGQWGRSWHSLPGGLFLSLGWKIKVSDDRLSLLPFAVAWGVADQLQNRGIPVQLKWPNDLLLAGKKLGGILVETRKQAIVVGIGINWENTPPAPGIALKTYQLEQRLTAIDGLEDLAAMVIRGILEGILQWSDPKIPLHECVDRYEALFAQRGQWIPVGSEVGKILGITATGALRLEVNGVEQSWQLGQLRLGY